MPPPAQAEDGAAAAVRGLGPVGGARRNAIRLEGDLS